MRKLFNNQPKTCTEYSCGCFIEKLDEVLQIIRFDYNQLLRLRNGNVGHRINVVEVFQPVNLLKHTNELGV
jgi:hypothetical protein